MQTAKYQVLALAMFLTVGAFTGCLGDDEEEDTDEEEYTDANEEEEVYENADKTNKLTRKLIIRFFGLKA